MKKKKTIGKALIIAGLTVLLVAVIIAFLPMIIDAAAYFVWLFAPFLFSYILSLLVNPMADALQKRFCLPRGVSAIFVIVLTVGVIGGILTAAIWKVVDEIKEIYENFPIIYENIRITWYRISENLSNFVSMMPQTFQNALNDLGDGFLTWFAGLTPDSDFMRSAGNFAKKVPSIFISLVIFLLSLYFMVADSKTVSNVIKKPFSENFIERVSQIRGDIKHYVGGYVKAQLIIMCISFTILIIGLSILKIDYALVIALVTAIFDALPFFGSGAVLWPWALIAFIMGDVVLGIGLVIIYLFVILTRQFIEPKIVSKNIGLHPIATLMAMYIGYKILSIGGMILGPMILVIIVSLYKVGIFDGAVKTVKNLFFKIVREVKNIIKIYDDEGEK